MFPLGLEESMPQWLRILAGILMVVFFIWMIVTQMISLHNTVENKAVNKKLRRG